MDVKITDSSYGLIGEKLGHSFSKSIHETLANYRYDLIELPKGEVESFLKKRKFRGINVTIPYKERVMPYLDFIDERAKNIGAVNTIVNQNGRLFGYNTDFAGFSYLLEQSGIDVRNKVVLIMGSGGTCKTVSAVLQSQYAGEILVASRTKSARTISYEEALNRRDIQVVINASPKGMYPHNEEQPIDLTVFPQLCGVVDVIYNPLKTKLLQQAQALGVKHANGLLMLVAQAKLAVEYFLDEKISDKKIDQVYQDIQADIRNLVLIGMPSCGKSLLGKQLADRLNRKFVDIDAVISERTGMVIADIFEQKGEDYFRMLEHDLTAEFAKEKSLVIATGGGVIKNNDNILNLQQNGVLAFIDRPIDELLIGNGRPLSNSSDQIAKLYQERYLRYIEASDFTVLNDGEIDDVLGELEQLFHQKN